jgi:hypothetical protein
MITLHLGVLDVAYSDASGGAETTGDVAEHLEANYHVMETFYELHQEQIAGMLADSMAQSIEALVNSGVRIDTGGRDSSAAHILKGAQRVVAAAQSGTLTYGADQKIEAEFRGFLDSGEMNRIYSAFTGSPISAAAVAGVNHRKLHPYAQANKARPAFVDTGLYRASFRAWTTEEP